MVGFLFLSLGKWQNQDLTLWLIRLQGCLSKDIGEWCISLWHSRIYFPGKIPSTQLRTISCNRLHFPKIGTITSFISHALPQCDLATTPIKLPSPLESGQVWPYKSLTTNKVQLSPGFLQMLLKTHLPEKFLRASFIHPSLHQVSVACSHYVSGLDTVLGTEKAMMHYSATVPVNLEQGRDKGQVGQTNMC